jgi:hypothetical protein
VNPVFDPIAASVFKTMSRFARERQAVNLAALSPLKEAAMPAMR